MYVKHDQYTNGQFGYDSRLDSVCSYQTQNASCGKWKAVILVFYYGKKYLC